jgi:PAS domain S-box-containing protein
VSLPLAGYTGARTANGAMRLQPTEVSALVTTQAVPPAQHRPLLISAEELVESITEAFCAVGRDWRFLYVNRQAEKLLAHTRGDLPGRNLWEEYPGLVSSEFERIFRRAAAENVMLSVTDYYPDHERWYEMHVYPATYGVSIYFRDVTHRKDAESELTRLAAEPDRLRRIYETALSNTADFNYTFDLQGRFTYVNRPLLALWQKSLPEAIDKNFHELGYPAELAERLQRQIDQVIRSAAPLRDETPYTSALGTCAYEYIFTPVIGADGAVVAVAGSTRDITERKEAEEALRESARQLTAADRRKDEFLATLAHELRNPLAPLRNGLQIMRLAGDNPQAIELARDMMERQLAQMVRLVDELLDLSRISRGRVELAKERVSLASVIQQALETSRPAIDELGHELTICLPPEPIYIDADFTRATQVFANVLNNAAKFTDRGGRIDVTVLEQGELAVVSVRDNGIGVASQFLSSIFEMFMQADQSTERHRSGLGIGLALVRGLVELHGGSVEARSAGEGLGSEFLIRWPTARPPAVSSQLDVQPAVAGTGRHRILVIDDNRDAAASLADLLRLKGNETCSAYDGLAGLRMAAEFRPDIVLLDLGMPGIDGFETARRMRAEDWGKDTVLIALSGWGQDQDRRESLVAGFNQHLVKPVEMSCLESLLRSYVPACRE